MRYLTVHPDGKHIPRSFRSVVADAVRQSRQVSSAKARHVLKARGYRPFPRHEWDERTRLYAAIRSFR